MANNVNIVINAQDKASKALGRISDKAKSMRGSFMAMTAIGGAVTGALGMMTKSALDQEIGINKLDSALKNVNSSYESQKVVIEKTLRALQDKTNFGDEEQREALTGLIRLTGDYEGSLKALPVVMDLAVGANMDFKNASQLMGKVLSGQTTALTRYGIELDKDATQTEILEELTRKFGGAAESAFDPINAMKNELGDLGQEIGNVLLPLFINVMDKLIPIIKGIVEWANKNPALMKAIVLTTGALGGLLLSLGILGLALPAIITGISVLTGSIFGLTAALYGIPLFGWILLAITGVVAAIAALWFSIKHIYDNWHKLNEGMKTALNGLIGPINALIKVFNAMTGAQLDHLEKFELATDRIAEKTKALGDTSAESYKDVWRSAEAMNQSLDDTNQSFNVANTSIGEIDESMKKLNETTKKSIALTEEQSELLMKYASSRRKWAEISNIEIENFAFENTVNLAYKQVQLEEETVEKKKEINKKYLDIYFDMYEESQKKIVEVVNKAHLEMESMEETRIRRRGEANKKAQMNEGMIPGLSNLPAFGTIGRTAEHAGAVMSAARGGLRKASGEMMTSAEMREFLGIKMSKTGEIPTIGGTGIPVNEVNINVSPELDAQINFSRVGDTMRNKQGDYTSGLGW